MLTTVYSYFDVAIDMSESFFNTTPVCVGRRHVTLCISNVMVEQLCHPHRYIKECLALLFKLCRHLVVYAIYTYKVSEHSQLSGGIHTHLMTFNKIVCQKRNWSHLLE